MLLSQEGNINFVIMHKTELWFMLKFNSDVLKTAGETKKAEP